MQELTLILPKSAIVMTTACMAMLLLTVVKWEMIGSLSARASIGRRADVHGAGDGDK